MSKRKPTRSLYIPAVRAGITLLLLWGIGAVLKELPMLQELTIPNFPFTVPAIVGMAISFLMAAAIIVFAIEFGLQLRRALPRFRQSGLVVSSLVSVVAILIAYEAFIPVGEYYLTEDFWIYQLGFLVLLLIPVAIGAVTLFRNAGKIVDLFTTRSVSPMDGQIVCRQCGEPNVPEARFCMECGADLPEVKPAGLLTCPECGATLSGDSRFCTECGALLESQEQPDTEDVQSACPECGAQLGADAVFCSECGAKLV
jgi:ribosomal protein L40E